MVKMSKNNFKLKKKKNQTINTILQFVEEKKCTFLMNNCLN